MAALAAAAQFANIANIASTQFGGTATRTTQSGAGGFGSPSTPQSPAPDLNTTPDNQGPGTVTVIIQTNDPLLDALFQGASARINDDDAVLIRSDSRQAAEIRGR